MKVAGRDGEREALIDCMLGATTARDAERAHASAEAWLKKHPGDLGVLAAQERLDGRIVGALDPDSGAGRVTLVLYVCAFSVAAVAVFALTGGLQAAGLAGLISVFALPWDGVGEAIADRRRGPGLSGRENGER